MTALEALFNRYRENPRLIADEFFGDFQNGCPSAFFQWAVNFCKAQNCDGRASCCQCWLQEVNEYIQATTDKKSDKYRWHDLRKNPDDLPPRAISITGTRTCHESDEVLAQDGAGYNFIAEYNHDAGKWVDTADYMPIKKGRLIAWREIEPFEVDEVSEWG